MSHNPERGLPRSSAPAGNIPGTSVTPTAPYSGLIAHQGHTKALFDAGIAMPDGIASIEGYLGSTVWPFRDGIEHDPSRMAERHVTEGHIQVARENGARYLILAYTCPERIYGTNPDGTKWSKVNPGTRHLESEKAIYAAIGGFELVIPDVVRHETSAQIRQFRADLKNKIAKEGHTCEVAASIELQTKQSQVEAHDLIIRPDIPVVALLPRGRKGWEILRKLMEDINDLVDSGENVLEGKRIIVYGIRRVPRNTMASSAMLALCRGVTQVILGAPRPYVPGDEEPRDPADVALDKLVYRPGRGSYAEAEQAVNDPAIFGPTADLDAILPGAPGWKIDKARDEGHRLEFLGIYADWKTARPMTNEQRKEAFPDLKAYLP